MLGEFVITARKRAGYDTQKALAEAVGRDQAWVSRLERGVGKETPPPEDMATLAKALHVSQHELLKAAGYELDAGPVADSEMIRMVRPVLESREFTDRQRHQIAAMVRGMVEMMGDGS